MVATQTTPIVLALARYLRANPQASDSLAGIARWWIDCKEPVVLDDAQHALDVLVRCGAVLATVAADGRVHYRLCDVQQLPESVLAVNRMETGQSHGGRHDRA